MKPSPSPVVLADAATVIKYTSYRGLKQACYIRMLSDEFIPRLKSRVFSAFPINIKNTTPPPLVLILCFNFIVFYRNKKINGQKKEVNITLHVLWGCLIKLCQKNKGRFFLPLLLLYTRFWRSLFLFYSNAVHDTIPDTGKWRVCGRKVISLFLLLLYFF